MGAGGSFATWTIASGPVRRCEGGGNSPSRVPGGGARASGHPGVASIAVGKRAQNSRPAPAGRSRVIPSTRFTRMPWRRWPYCRRRPCSPEGYCGALIAGVRWVTGNNEVGASLVDRDAGAIYRAIRRRSVTPTG
jgi:hypothetical protein